MATALLQVWSITEAGTPLRPLRADELIRNVESFVGAIATRLTTTRELPAAEREELMGQLFERVVILQRRYDRERDDPRQRAALAFDRWLYRELQRDAIDFLRQWRGRHGQKAVFDERLAQSELDHRDPLVDRPVVPSAKDAQADGEPRSLPDAWTDLRRDRPRRRPKRRVGPGSSAKAA